MRSIEKGIITIKWYNSNGNLIGLTVEQGNLELFEQKKWTHQMHEFTKNSLFQAQVWQALVWY